MGQSTKPQSDVQLGQRYYQTKFKVLMFKITFSGPLIQYFGMILHTIFWDDITYDILG
jgi:hypothetical protein